MKILIFSITGESVNLNPQKKPKTIFVDVHLGSERTNGVNQSVVDVGRRKTQNLMQC